MAGGIAPRPPVPTALKVLRGNPGKRPLNKDEPKPKVTLPEPPPHLKAYKLAVENWFREGGLLLKLGVMTEADWGVLSVRCYLYHEMVSMMKKIKKEGRTYVKTTTARSGAVTETIVTNPLVAQLDTSIAEYRRVGVLLGLDPSSRSRVKVSKEKDKGAFDEFF